MPRAGKGDGIIFPRGSATSVDSLVNPSAIQTSNWTDFGFYQHSRCPLGLRWGLGLAQLQTDPRGTPD
ncbi:Hypothetical protein NTJ_02346 [Nesidiocoris tenuis]|uniref:Uncharacterized protein n=1 Tax=Nesidiocoris tenuis TaxID=355587 RepID=A0ABN7ADV0_9HEMI|nr:Hypothetical protein NTJ_02346 [Nesidiocoris tenuis]